jgi:hypothetical protein
MSESKSWGAVKRGGKVHFRNYGRELKNGQGLTSGEVLRLCSYLYHPGVAIQQVIDAMCETNRYVQEILDANG